MHVVREERGRTPSLHATDVSRSDEDGRVEHDTGQGENTPGAEQSKAVAEEDDGPPERSCCSLNLQTSSVSSALLSRINGTHLMILQSHVAQEGIICLHSPHELLEFRLLLVDLVSSDEPFVELDDLAQREVLAWRSIQSSGSLYELKVGRQCQSRWRQEEDGP